jgi:hypothetical protein
MIKNIYCINNYIIEQDNIMIFDRVQRVPKYALLSSLLDPLEGLSMLKCGMRWNLGSLPTSSTKGVRGAC